MSFIHYMPLKLIKTKQKYLIFLSLLGVLINKILIKYSKLILLYFISFENT